MHIHQKWRTGLLVKGLALEAFLASTYNRGSSDVSLRKRVERYDRQPLSIKKYVEQLSKKRRHYLRYQR